MFMNHYAPNRCEPSIVIVKMEVRPGGGGLVGNKVGVGGVGDKWGGGQGGCEPTKN